MRIALCFAGLPRHYEKGYEYYAKNLFDLNENVDVFFHTWNDTEHEKVAKLYKPKDYSTSEKLDANIINKQYTRCADAVNFPAYATVSSFFSIYHSCLLKTNYEMRNGFQYDWVIKTRFDYALSVPLAFNSLHLDSSKVYVPHCRMNVEHDFCNDQFGFSSSNNMNKYMSTYLLMNHFYDQGTIMNAEDMLSANLKYHSLIGDRLLYVDMKNPFPPGSKNATPHSLIRE
jgi:hypothetical protein